MTLGTRANLSLRNFPITLLWVSTLGWASPLLGQDFDYEDQVNRIRSGDPQVDISRLREEYPKTEGYSPYDNEIDDQEKKVHAAFQAENYEEALAMVDELLAKNPLYPDAYMAAMACHLRLGHQDKVDAYAAILRAMFDDITNESMCRDPDRPCRVLATYEEYFVLRSLRLVPGGQELTTCADVPCDILTGIDSKTNQEVPLFFDITLPHAWLDRHFAEEKDDP